MKWFLTLAVITSTSASLGLMKAPNEIAIPIIAILTIFMVTINYRSKKS